MQLRFVEKDIMVPHPQHKDVSYVKTVRILQQWWEEEKITSAKFLIGPGDIPVMEMHTNTHGEWREVPLEKNT